MLESVSDKPIHIRELTATRDESKPQLPSKRKRDFLSDPKTHTKPFTIRPYPDSPHAKSASLKPIRVISRSQLPLTFLDTSAEEQSPPNSLFTARIDVLENDKDNQEQEVEAPKVLIAECEVVRSLYAVERVQARIYTICKLAPWLKVEDMVELWDPANVPAYPVPSDLDASQRAGGLWWQHAVV